MELQTQKGRLSLDSVKSSDPGGIAAACLLGLRFRTPPEAWMCVSCECCEIEVSVLGRSLVQRSPNERDVSVIVKPRQ
jgi:hypothetical protein